MGRGSRTGRELGSRALVLALLLVVATAVGVSVGGAILAGLGVTLAIIAVVTGLAFWRRRRRALAVVSYAVAVLATAGAVIGFVDAIG